MLIDLFFLPVHVPVGAPDVAQQILAVCKVVVVELVLKKNNFGFLATYPDSEETSQNLRC